MDSAEFAEALADGDLGDAYSETLILDGLALCRPETFLIRRVTDCPTCSARRRFVGLHAGFWYSVTWTCCGCGDRWTDGERHDRPFRRGWRKDAVEKARSDYRSAQPRSAYLAWVREHFATATGVAA